MRDDRTGWRRVGPAAAATAMMLGSGLRAGASDYTFAARTGTAEWVDPASWGSTGGYPNAAGDTATIRGSNAIRAGLTVDVNAPVTVSALALAGGTVQYAYPTVVSSSNGGSVTFAAATAGGSATLGDAGGAQLAGDTLAATVYLAAPLAVTSGDRLTVSGTIADAPGTGSHPLTFASPDPYVQGGLVNLTGDNQFTGPITVTAMYVALSGRATGWGQSAGVTLNRGGFLQLYGATPARAVPITMAGGGVILAGSDLANGGAFASTVASPITIMTGTIISQSSLTLSGPITGTDGSLTLDSEPTYGMTRPTITASGTVDLGGGPLTVRSATYNTGQGDGGTVVLSGADNRVGPLTATGVTLALSGRLTATSAALGQDGSIQIGTGGPAGDLAVAAVSAAGGSLLGGLVFDRSDAYTFAPVVSGPVNLKQIGPGTTTLTATHPGISGTDVEAGTLRVTAGSAIGTRELTVNNTANVGPGTVGTTVTLELDNAAQSVASLSGAVAAPANGSNGAVISLAGPTALTVSQSTPGTFAGRVTGPGSLTKAGSATLALAGANDYVGPTNVSAGTLAVGAGGTTGSLSGGGGVTVGAGATLAFNRSDRVAVGYAIDGGGQVVQAGAGTLSLTNPANTYAGGTTIGAGTVLFDDLSELGTGGITGTGGYPGVGGTLRYAAGTTVDVTTARAVATAGYGLVIDTGGNGVTFAGNVSGSGGFGKAGDGTLTLAGPYTYGGSTTVTGGTLAVSARSALGTGPLAVANNGPSGSAVVLTLNGAAQTVRGLTGGVAAGAAATVNLNGTALTVSTYTDRPPAYAGGIAGAGSLTVGGYGTLVLTGPLSYAGPTTVTAGTLAFDAGANGPGVSVRSLAGPLVVTGGTARVSTSPAARRTALFVPALTVATAGTVDVGTGDLVVHNGSLAAITALAARGLDAGYWDGTGVSSSAAAADPTGLLAVGVIQNVAAAAGGSTSLYTTFDGQTVAATDVIARLTYYGDANLDGMVNAADFTRLDAGAVLRLTGWQNGDFNYDGVVDGSDYALADNAFNRQAGGVSSPTSMVAASTAVVAGPAAAVPEPGPLGLLAAGGLLVTRGRRRSTT